MSYDLRLAIDGYVEHCINQKAQESYLAKLNAQLDELESKADKWDDKEAPKFATYTPAFQSYYSAGDECEVLCQKCECSLDEYDWENKPNIKYCPECGQRIYSIDEQEEIFRKSKTEYPNGIILDWGE